jgi:hypothetical protein
VCLFPFLRNTVTDDTVKPLPSLPPAFHMLYNVTMTAELRPRSVSVVLQVWSSLLQVPVFLHESIVRFYTAIELICTNQQVTVRCIFTSILFNHFFAYLAAIYTHTGSKLRIKYYRAWVRFLVALVCNI